MKRLSILFMVAVLLLTSFAMPTLAYEPTALTKPNQATERNRHRRHHRRGRRGNDWVGFGVGAAIGALIASGVADDSSSTTYYYAPAPQPVLVYDPNCNCYYYVQQ